ncbi:Hypothetical_protein [Hexamita inflata]|uniref:Hypothetical_protein n=1 Tax=Hexamita inflata TaxID=28002 RepID=A0AA86US93_9EUKA|nr:Hypothetical protein HINF_LOCUS57345 [Hexamita inflata]
MKELAAQTELYVPLDPEYSSYEFIPLKQEKICELIKQHSSQNTGMQIFRILLQLFNDCCQENQSGIQIGLSPIRAEQLIKQLQNLHSSSTNDCINSAKIFVEQPMVQNAYQFSLSLQELFQMYFEADETLSGYPVVFPGAEINQTIVIQNCAIAYDKMNATNIDTVFVQPNFKLLCVLNKAQSNFDACCDHIEQLINELNPITIEEFQVKVNQLLLQNNFSSIPSSLYCQFIFKEVSGDYTKAKIKMNTQQLIPQKGDKETKIFDINQIDTQELQQFKSLFKYLMKNTQNNVLELANDTLQELSKYIQGKLKAAIEQQLKQPSAENLITIKQQIEAQFEYYLNPKQIIPQPLLFVILPRSELCEEVLSDIMNLNYAMLELQNSDTVFIKPSYRLLLLLNKAYSDFNAYGESVANHTQDLDQVPYDQINNEISGYRKQNKLQMLDSHFYRQFLINKGVILEPLDIQWVPTNIIPEFKCFQVMKGDSEISSEFKVLFEFLRVNMIDEELIFDSQSIQKLILDCSQYKSEFVKLAQAFIQNELVINRIYTADSIIRRFNSILNTQMQQFIILPLQQVQETQINSILNNEYELLALQSEKTLVYKANAKLLTVLAHASTNFDYYAEMAADIFDQMIPISREQLKKQSLDRQILKTDPDFYQYFAFELDDEQKPDFTNCKVKTADDLLIDREDVLTELLKQDMEIDSLEQKQFKVICQYLLVNNKNSVIKISTQGILALAELLADISSDSTLLRNCMLYADKPDLLLTIQLCDSLTEVYTQSLQLISNSYFYFPDGEISPESIQLNLKQQFTADLQNRNTLIYKGTNLLTCLLIKTVKNEDKFLEPLGDYLNNLPQMSYEELKNEVGDLRIQCQLKQIPESLTSQLFMKGTQVELIQQLSELIPINVNLELLVTQKYPSISYFVKNLNENRLNITEDICKLVHDVQLNTVVDYVLACDILIKDIEEIIETNKIQVDIFFCFNSFSPNEIQQNIQQRFVDVKTETKFYNPTTKCILQAQQGKYEEVRQEIQNCKQLDSKQLKKYIVGQENYLNMNPKLLDLYVIDHSQDYKRVNIELPSFWFNYIIPISDDESFVIFDRFECSDFIKFVKQNTKLVCDQLFFNIDYQSLSECNIEQIKQEVSKYLKTPNEDTVIKLFNKIFFQFDQILGQAQQMIFVIFKQIVKEEILLNLQQDYSLFDENYNIYHVTIIDVLEMYKFALDYKVQMAKLRQVTFDEVQLIIDSQRLTHKFQIDNFNHNFVFTRVDNENVFVKLVSEEFQLIPTVSHNILALNALDTVQDSEFKAFIAELKQNIQDNHLRITTTTTDIHQLYNQYLQIETTLKMYLSLKNKSTVICFPDQQINEQIVLQNSQQTFKLEKMLEEGFCFQGNYKLILLVAKAAEQFQQFEDRIIEEIYEHEPIESVKNYVQFIKQSGFENAIKPKTQNTTEVAQLLSQIEISPVAYIAAPFTTVPLKIKSAHKYFNTLIEQMQITPQVSDETLVEFQALLNQKSGIYVNYQIGDYLSEFLAQDELKPIYELNNKALLLLNKLLLGLNAQLYKELADEIVACEMVKFQISAGDQVIQITRDDLLAMQSKLAQRASLSFTEINCLRLVPELIIPNQPKLVNQQIEPVVQIPEPVQIIPEPVIEQKQPELEEIPLVERKKIVKIVKTEPKPVIEAHTEEETKQIEDTKEQNTLEINKAQNEQVSPKENVNEKFKSVQELKVDSEFKAPSQYVVEMMNLFVQGAEKIAEEDEEDEETKKLKAEIKELELLEALQKQEAEKELETKPETEEKKETVPEIAPETKQEEAKKEEEIIPTEEKKDEIAPQAIEEQKPEKVEE